MCEERPGLLRRTPVREHEGEGFGFFIARFRGDNIRPKGSAELTNTKGNRKNANNQQKTEQGEATNKGNEQREASKP